MKYHFCCLLNKYIGMSTSHEREYEQELLECLERGDRNAFHTVFVRYYADLVMYAGTIIQRKDVCEDVVQDVFVKILNMHGRIRIKSSLKAYLLSMVHNRCLGMIEHEQVEKHYVEYYRQHPVSDSGWEDYVLYSDFSCHLEEALGTLSEKERLVFVNCLMNDRKPKDVSVELDIPLRTVQYNLQKATLKLAAFFAGIGLFAVLLPFIIFSI